MKKILLAFIFALMSTALVFCGCSGVYDNMKLEISCDGEIVMFLDEEIDDGQGELQEGEAKQSEFEFSATISGVNDGVSKEVIVVSEDESKLHITQTYIDDVNKIVLQARQTGIVNVLVTSKEGGKTKNIVVNIIRKTTSLDIDENYKFAVMANGEKYRIDESKLIQQPADASNSGYIYSIKSPVEGVVVSEDGYIQVQEKNAESFVLVIKPKYATSDDVAVELEVPILDVVREQDITLYLTDASGKTEQVENETLAFVKNKKYEGTKTLSFDLTKAEEKSNFKLIVTLSSDLVVIDEASQTFISCKMIATQIGEESAKIEIVYKEFENVVAFSKTFAVIVKDIPNNILLNNSNENMELNVFNLINTYSSGVEFVINVLPDTAQNRKFKIVFEDEYKDIIVVTNSSKRLVDECVSGQKLYIYHKLTPSTADWHDLDVKMTIVPTDTDAEIRQAFTLHLMLAIEAINTNKSLILVEGVEALYQLNYDLEPAGANKSLVNVVSSNTSVAEVEFNSELNTHIVKVKSIGKTKFSFYVANRLYASTQVEVVSNFRTFFLDVDSPSDNVDIAKREQESVYGDYGAIIGNTTINAVVKVSKRVKFGVSIYPETSKINSVKYFLYKIVEGEKVEVKGKGITIDSNGYLVATNAIKDCYLDVSVVGYVVNGSGEVVLSDVITRTTSVSSIIPITDISLNASNVLLYDIDTVGYNNSLIVPTQDKLDTLTQKHLVLNVSPINSTFNAKDVEWSVSDPNYNDCLKLQDDGSVLFVAKLPSTAGEQQTVVVRAVIQEYDNIMSRECTITIKKAPQVEDILLEDYDSNKGVDLKAYSNGSEPDSYQIKASARPASALNTNLEYFAFDITKKPGAGDDWIAKKEYTFDLQQKVSKLVVDKDGLVVVNADNEKAKEGGYVVVFVVPSDNIAVKGQLTENEIKRKSVDLVFHLADGTKDNPYVITNYQGLLDINYALDKNYVLGDNIDLNNVDIFESIANVANPFNGSFNGQRALYDGSVVQYKIYNYKLNIGHETLFVQQYCGIFACIGSAGKIENLYVTTRNISVNANLTMDFNFGVIAGCNKGTLKNCHVDFGANATFEFSSEETFSISIGGLVGENEGFIDVAENNEVLTQKSQVKSLNNSALFVNCSEKQNAYVGGLVGHNKTGATISGLFEFVGDESVESGSQILINADINQTYVSSLLSITTTSPNVCVGGVVGLNNGTTTNVSFAGKLSGKNIVGGVIAQNNTFAQHLLSYGVIKGEQNVGGVLGINNGDVEFAVFEVYDEETHIIANQDETLTSETQITNLGGVVGSNNGMMLYCFANSYCAQKDLNERNFDINVCGAKLQNVGSFAGTNLGTISCSYSNMSLNCDESQKNNVHNFVSNGVLSDCYSLGYINLKPTVSQTQYGTINISNWITISGKNYGLPMLKIDSTSLLISEPPKSIDLEFKEYSSSNKYYKYAEKQAVLFYNYDLVEDSSKNLVKVPNIDKNTYDILTMLQITIYPKTKRTCSLGAVVVEGSSVLIQGDKLITVGNGYAKIKIYSFVDNSIFDEIEIYVVDGITDINVDNAIDGKIVVQKNTTKELVLSNLNANGIAYSLGGYVYHTNGTSYFTFDNATQWGDNNLSVSKEFAQYLMGLESTQGQFFDLEISPYVIINFTNEKINEKKFELYDIKYHLGVQIYNGVQGMNIDKSSGQIMPSETSIVEVILDTDIESDFVKKIVAQYFDGNEIIEIELDVVFESGKWIIQNDGKINEKLTIEIWDFEYNATKCKKSIYFAITPSKKIGDFEVVDNYIIIFESGEIPHREHPYNVSYNLDIIPQVVTDATIKHFNDGEAFDDNLKGAGQQESSYILVGSYGLLTIDLHPEYSSYSQLVLTSSLLGGQGATFQQVYYNEEDDNYSGFVSGSYNVDNGISLVRVSTKREGKDVFTGRIYVKTLLSSDVGIGQDITFTISAYSGDESVLTYQKSLTLLTQALPYLKTALTNNCEMGYVADATSLTFAIECGSSLNKKDVQYEIYCGELKITGNVSGIEPRIVGGISRYDIDLVIDKKLEVEGELFWKLGESYKIEVIISQSISGIIQKNKETLNFMLVDIVINSSDDMYLEIATNSEGEYKFEKLVDGKLSKSLNTEGYRIRVGITAVYADIYQSHYDAFIKSINLPKNFIGIWAYKTATNSWITLSEGETGSGNYSLVLDKNNDTIFGTRWVITGKNTLNTDVLKNTLDIAYSSGAICLCNTSEAMLNYEQQFALDFSLSSSKDHPLPVNNEEEFKAMLEGGNYILMSNITLKNYTPLSTEISSFDGNSYCITIESFALETKESSSIEIGLFKTIAEDTILKNVNIVFPSGATKANTIELALTKYSQVYVGMLAGVNMGTITNCSITTQQSESKQNQSKGVLSVATSLSSEATTNIVVSIGGLVGVNNGSISNSRVENIEILGTGSIGGFAGTNVGKIASSYSQGVKITSTYGYLGGFVAVNDDSATILTSYVKGEFSATNSTVDSGKLIRADVLMLESAGSIGGFVNQNLGSIQDCYSNIKLRSQSRSAGFVYSSAKNSVIKNCISFSDVAQNNIAHMPFIGTSEQNVFLNEGTLENAYYLQYDDERDASGITDKFINTDIAGSESKAQNLTLTEMKDPQYLLGFNFSDIDEVESSNVIEYSNVWVMPNNNSTSTFKPGNNLFQNYVPELVDANVIAVSHREIDHVAKDESGLDVYFYKYIGNDYGNLFNPCLISDAEDFQNVFANLNDSTDFKGNLRLIRDVDFATYLEKLSSTKVTYKGIFNGNGFSMENISLVIELNSEVENFGLFASLKAQYDNSGLVYSYASVKNLSLVFTEVKASQINVVGGLAGTADDAVITGVNVSGEDMAVKGNHIVGGVVGLVKNKSRIFNVSSHISVNAGYNNPNADLRKAIYYDDVDSAYYDKTIVPREKTTDIDCVSYAGTVAGVLDTRIHKLLEICYSTPSVYGVKVSGDVKSVGGVAGGAFGQIGPKTYVANVAFEVASNQFVNGNIFEGGIVGVNLGKLEMAQIQHKSEFQDTVDNLSYGKSDANANTTLFKVNTQTIAAGGIVGFNFGGKLLNSYSKVDVRNVGANSAGGAIGATIAGDIRAVYASGSVLASSNIGGLIGEIPTTNIGKDAKVCTFYNLDYLPLELSKDSLVYVDSVVLDSDKDNNTMTLSYVVAGNNWLDEDQTLNSKTGEKNWGGMIGFMTPTNGSYINSVQPQEKEEEANYVNFYVAGNSTKTPLPANAIGGFAKGISEESKTLLQAIGTPILYSDLTYQNKSKYFGNWSRFVWDLTTSSKFPVINPKTQNQIIEIATLSDLIQIIWKMDGDYILVNDIDMKTISNWMPIGTKENPFCGTFTSRIKSTGSNNINEYYTLKNLRISTLNAQYVGLFGVTGVKRVITSDGFVFENVSFKNINITIKDFVVRQESTNETYVGGLVGYAKGVTIENCSVSPARNIDSSVVSTIKSNAEYVGGLVGKLDKFVVSYTDGTQTKTEYFYSNISNCVSTIDIAITNSVVKKTSYVGGLVAYVAGSSDKTDSEHKNDINLSWTKQRIYVDTSTDNYINNQLYNCNVVIGGLVASNSDNGFAISNSFSLSDIEIAKLNCEKNAPSITMGGCVGELNANVYVSNCFAGGTIKINQYANIENINYVLVGGFVGDLSNCSARTITATTNAPIADCYSVVSFDTNLILETVKGFAGKYDANDVYLTDSQACKIKNCYYDSMLALLPNVDFNFALNTKEMSELSIKNMSRKSNNIYPLIYTKINSKDILLGNNHATIKAFGELVDDKIVAGNKFNPIQINNVENFNQYIYEGQKSLEKETTKTYNYYWQTHSLDLTQKINLNSSNTEACDITNSLIYNESFHGFYNGCGLTISNFVLDNTDVVAYENLKSQYVNDTQWKYIPLGSKDCPNLGLFGTLENNSVIAGVNLENLNVSIQHQGIFDPENTKEIQSEEYAMNVGGLVGYAKAGSKIFASTVKGEVNAVVGTNDVALNVAGLVGECEGAQIITCANYADVSSYDYKQYYNLNSVQEWQKIIPTTLNMGTICGNFVNVEDSTEFDSNLSKYIIQLENVYAFGDLRYTNAKNSNAVGKLVGNSSTALVYSYYAVVNVSKRDNSFENKNVKVVGSDVATLLKEKTFSMSTLNVNYGYPTFSLIEKSSYEKTAYQDGDKTIVCVVDANVMSAIMSSGVECTIKLDKDINAGNMALVNTSFAGVIDGKNKIVGDDSTKDYHTIYDIGVSSAGAFFVGAKIELRNLQLQQTVVSTKTLVDNSPNVVLNNVSAPNYKIGASVKLELDQCLCQCNYVHANNYNTQNIIVSKTTKEIQTDAWVNLKSTSNNFVLRNFVEQWSSVDDDCIFYDYDYQKAQVESETDVIYIVLNDKYQLSKFLKDNIDETPLSTQSIKICLKSYSDYDLQGKIWDGLKLESKKTNSLLGCSSTIEGETKLPTISNMYCEGFANVGFISSINETTSQKSVSVSLSNLRFTNTKVAYYKSSTENATTSQYFGVVAGYANGVNAKNITIDGNLAMTLPNSIYVGGAFGYVYGKLDTIANCVYDENIFIVAYGLLGGIAGGLSVADVTFVNQLSNSCQVYGVNYVGGLVGKYEADNLATGIPENPEFGCNGTNANIYGVNYVGGIAGMSGGEIYGASNDGNVYGSGNYVGGIVGFNDWGVIKSITNTANVMYNKNSVVGIVGEDDFSTIDLQAKLTNEVGLAYGGIVGYNKGSIAKAQNTNSSANISALNFVGGIVGYNEGKVLGKNASNDSGSYNTKNYSSVNGNSFVGGIVGYNATNARIEQSQLIQAELTNATTNGQAFVGGIAGFNDGWIDACKSECSMGNGSGISAYYVGGIAGFNAQNGILQTSISVVRANCIVQGDTTYVGLKLKNIENKYYVSGISAVNKGLINKCRVEDSRFEFNCATNKGVNMAGVCVDNLGTISETLVETSVEVRSSMQKIGTQLDEVFAGFVVYNAEYDMEKDNKIVDSYSLWSRYSKSFDTIKTSGFVYSNSGKIQNVYGVSTDGTYSGFINNVGYGTVENSYCVKINAGGYVVIEGDNKTQYKEFVENNYNIISSIRLSPINDEYIYDYDESNETITLTNGFSFVLNSTNGSWADSNPKEALKFNASLTLKVKKGSDAETWFVINKDDEKAKLTRTNPFAWDELKDILYDGVNELKLFTVISNTTSIYTLNWTGQYVPPIKSTTGESVPEYDSGIKGVGKEFEIYNLQDLATIQRLLDSGDDFSGITINLMHDLNFGGTYMNLIGMVNNNPLPFNGTFNGNGYSIIDYVCDGGNKIENAGLFAQLGAKAEVKNLNFINCRICNCKNVGLVAGINYGKINNIQVICSPTYSISGYGNVGAVVGINISNADGIGVVQSCLVNCEYNNIEKGGVYGYYNSSVSEINVGGACGLNNGTILLCETTGGAVYYSSTNGSTINIGGIVGKNSSSVDQCQNYASVEMDNTIVATSINVGGIVGWQTNGSTSNVINQGSIANVACGGVIGTLNAGKVKYCISLGAITGGNLFIGNNKGGSCDATTFIVDSKVETKETKQKLTENQRCDVARRVENFPTGFFKGGNTKDEIWSIPFGGIDEKGNYTSNGITLQGLPSNNNIPMSFYLFNGRGTEDSPFLIESGKQLLLWKSVLEALNYDELSIDNAYKFKSDELLNDIQKIYNLGQYYKIDCRLHYGEDGKTEDNKEIVFNTWNPIHKFQVNLDGNGYTFNLGDVATYVYTYTDVNGVVITQTYSGFIAQMTGGCNITNTKFVIKSMTTSIENPSEQNMLYCGGIVGYATSVYYPENDDPEKPLLFNGVSVLYVGSYPDHAIGKQTGDVSYNSVGYIVGYLDWSNYSDAKFVNQKNGLINSFSKVKLENV